MDALLAFWPGLRGHNFSCEIQHLVKEHSVGRAEFVRNFSGLTLGEGSVFAHPFQHVTATTLQKVTRQPLALFRCSGRQIKRRKVAVNQTKQRLKLVRLAAVRCRREHDKVLLILVGDATQEVVTLLLTGTCTARTSASMGFVHNDEFGALADKHVASRVALDVINAQNLKRKMLKHAGVAVNLTVETRLRVGANDHGFDTNLGANFLLPLVAQMRQAKHGEAFDDAAFEKFTDNQQCLNRFANANVIGY